VELLKSKVLPAHIDSSLTAELMVDHRQKRYDARVAGFLTDSLHYSEYVICSSIAGVLQPAYGLT
jgi:hypothetical protein